MDVYVVCNARYHDTNFTRLGLLGSRFIAHPANQGVKIRLTDVKHPLTFGLKISRWKMRNLTIANPLANNLGC